MKFSKAILFFKKFLKFHVIISSSLFTVFIILSFTTLPFWMYYYLGISPNILSGNPDYIVVMGGGGMPSESGLMRTYFAGESAKKYPNAKFIIALPGDTSNTKSSLFLMKNELVKRGIDSSLIHFEPNGTNTRSQAMQIKKMVDSTKNILLITSPEHMYRAVKSFIKVGLINTGGVPTFEKAIEYRLIFNDDELGGNELIPGVGNNTQLRYQFWYHVKLQIIVYREYFAIAYYKLKFWI
jgi:uncharacterized SAM-binding protein YcdF (DUF218 family)